MNQNSSDWYNEIYKPLKKTLGHTQNKKHYYFTEIKWNKSDYLAHP